MRLLTVICAAVIALYPALSALAAPVRAVVYPDFARVTETATLPLTQTEGGAMATFTLPHSADPNSLRFSLENAGDLTLKDLSVDKDVRQEEARIAAAREAHAKAVAELQDLVDARAAHTATADYWKSLSTAVTRRDASEFATAIHTGVLKSLRAASELIPQIQDAEDKAARLRRKLNDLTGGSDTAWLVTARFSGHPAATARATYSYRLNNCGWSAHYVINAHPKKGAVEVAWDAVITQKSGQEWKDVALTLSTARFTGGTVPPQNRPWVIQPVQVRPRVKTLRAADANMEMAMMAAPAAGGPQATQRTAFDEYDAGTVSIQSGDTRRIALRRLTWKADFDAIIRPQVSDRAYVHAAIELDAAPRLPRGEASFLLDSAFIHKRSFAMNDTTADLYFGADPFLNVSLTTDDKTSGSEGFLTTKNTYDWNWTLTVRNQHATPVDIRVEDALPQLRDKAISVDMRLGGADKEDGLAVWTATLAPGAEERIQYGYSLEWPKDMHLDLGGR